MSSVPDTVDTGEQSKTSARFAPSTAVADQVELPLSIQLLPSLPTVGEVTASCPSDPVLTIRTRSVPRYDPGRVQTVSSGLTVIELARSLLLH